MRAARVSLRDLVGRLRAAYGLPPPPLTRDPFEMAVWESAVYLVDDTVRARVFANLKKAGALKPKALFEMPDELLLPIIREGGMRPPDRAAKLRKCAAIALEVGTEKLRRDVREDPERAAKILRRFPGIGEPGADKILLYNGSRVTLAPDSNVLRVLVRIGFGQEEGDYTRTYRSAMQAVAPELPSKFRWLVAARELLRRHGQTLCKTTRPRCEVCPVAAECNAFRTKKF